MIPGLVDGGTGKRTEGRPGGSRAEDAKILLGSDKEGQD